MKQHQLPTGLGDAGFKDYYKPADYNENPKYTATGKDTETTNKL